MAEQYISYRPYSDDGSEYAGVSVPLNYVSIRKYNDPTVNYLGEPRFVDYNSNELYSSPEMLYGGGYTPFPAAIGSGQGTETATGVTIRATSGSGSGTSSETATRLIKRFRTATGSGQGTQTGVGVRVAFRTATGFGSSGESALWTKSLIFRPPVEDKFPWADYREQTPDHALFGYVRQGNRARNVYLLKDGTFTNVDPLDPAKVDKTYLGGHEWFVTPEEKAVLIAAGYTVT